MKTSKVKIGILVDNEKLDFFSYEVIEWLRKNNEYFDICLINQNLKKENFFLKIIKILNIFQMIKMINKYSSKKNSCLESTQIKNT